MLHQEVSRFRTYTILTQFPSSTMCVVPENKGSPSDQAHKCPPIIPIPTFQEAFFKHPHPLHVLLVQASRNVPHHVPPNPREPRGASPFGFTVKQGDWPGKSYGAGCCRREGTRGGAGCQVKWMVSGCLMAHLGNDVLNGFNISVAIPTVVRSGRITMLYL